MLGKLNHVAQHHPLQLSPRRSKTFNALPLDLFAQPEVVEENNARSAWRCEVLSTSGSCRDERTPASASPASTSPMGRVSLAHPVGLRPQAAAVTTGRAPEEEVQTLSADMTEGDGLGS